MCEFAYVFGICVGVALVLVRMWWKKKFGV